MSFGWSDERVQTLTVLWLDGVSATQIAHRFGGGLTRNAVIGKVHRLGLAGARGSARCEPAPPKGAPEKTPAPLKANGSLGARQRAARNPWAAGPRVAPAPLPAPAPVTAVARILAQLGRGMCRFPLDDPGPGQMEHALFCAAPLEEGEIRYCAEHKRVCFQPMAAKRKERSLAPSAAPAHKGDPFVLFPSREAA